MIQPYLNLMNAGKHSLEPINEEIGSERTKRLRREGLKRKLKPHSFDTVRETMVPHPTLAEIPIWTKYYMKDKYNCFIICALRIFINTVYDYANARK